jgi:hypothetical protein
MTDPTEGIRRFMVHAINSDVESTDKATERARLEALYPDGVWDTGQIQETFEVLGFCAPFCIARRKIDGKKGALMFQDDPRFYFDFKPV